LHNVVARQNPDDGRDARVLDRQVAPIDQPELAVVVASEADNGRAMLRAGFAYFADGL
jgi:hypothetical protein